MSAVITIGLAKNKGITEASLKLKTKVFELGNGRYRNVSELAEAIGMSSSHIYRVRRGERRISEKFIIGAMKAFPEYRFDDLFYLASEDERVEYPEAKE